MSHGILFFFLPDNTGLALYRLIQLDSTRFRLFVYLILQMYWLLCLGERSPEAYSNEYGSRHVCVCLQASQLSQFGLDSYALTTTASFHTTATTSHNFLGYGIQWPCLTVRPWIGNSSIYNACNGWRFHCTNHTNYKY